ncbi:MAG: phosphoribosyl-AMP cyclohydrolase [Methanocellales archaeon]
MKEIPQEILQEINFKDGLIAAVVQDFKTNEVLMCAFMNKEALEISLSTGRMCFYSRSRRRLWVKGESSGHFQYIKEVRIDCDGDSLLFKVEQIKAACHEGYRSCYFRKLENGKWKVVEPKIVQKENDQ